MESCIYNGWVRHRRYEPSGHQFRYELFMMYLDLAELPRLFDDYWCWSTRGAALARFKRSDYHHALDDGDGGHHEPGLDDEPSLVDEPSLDNELSLDEAVRRTVTAQTGRRPDGPIRMLTHLRYFGYIFNPVTFYYCFDHGGATVQTVLAEITNTPWKERHAYVLPTSAATRNDTVMRFEFGKEFHVSPFWPMELRYDWRLSVPGDELRIHMDNLRHRGSHARRVFDATLALHREEISSAALARALLKYPLITAKVSGAIYWQALRLWLRRTPFFTHPKRTATP